MTLMASDSLCWLCKTRYDDDTMTIESPIEHYQADVLKIATVVDYSGKRFFSVHSLPRTTRRLQHKLEKETFINTPKGQNRGY